MGQKAWNYSHAQAVTETCKPDVIKCYVSFIRAIKQFVTCDRGSHDHRHGHQAQQEANGLGHVFGTNQLKCDRSHDRDEAAIKQPHQQTHSNQPAEDAAQRDHHGHDADDKEGCHLGQHRGVLCYLNLDSFILSLCF